jgi:hypothetical protein
MTKIKSILAHEQRINSVDEKYVNLGKLGYTIGSTGQTCSSDATENLFVERQSGLTCASKLPADRQCPA